MMYELYSCRLDHTMVVLHSFPMKTVTKDPKSVLASKNATDIRERGLTTYGTSARINIRLVKRKSKGG